MNMLELRFASGEDTLSVRRFSVREGISRLFTVSVEAVSPHHDLDLAALVGRPASLRVASGAARCWAGVCSEIEQLRAETTGLSTYALRIVPALWLLDQRNDYRVHQQLTIPEIVDRILGEWGIVPAWSVDRGAYPVLEYKVQYGESDHAFLIRLLDEAGIAFTFTDDEGGARLALGDKLHAGAPHRASPILHVDDLRTAALLDRISQVRIAHRVRPDAWTIRDHDFRNPGFSLVASAGARETFYERYHYRPGSFLVDSPRSGDTPFADDRGAARHDPRAGAAQAERSLLAARADRRKVRFATSAIDLGPGSIFSIAHHPHAELSERATLLVTDLTIEGSLESAWSISGEAVFADQPYHPAPTVPRPLVTGVQSAVVVGPRGQEIHTDEFGRVRVQFPWDRRGERDEQSSCWIRVSQGAAGVGYGMVVIPRVGEEVLVGFVAGNPDQPIIVGRVHNGVQRAPYKLPEHQTRSTWKSRSTPGGEGSNEIMFEDLQGQELVYLQAQRNLRTLVKGDQTITVGQDHRSLVKGSETDIAFGNRVEVTGASRAELTGANRTTSIGGDEQTLVRGTVKERGEGDWLLRVGGDQHVVIAGAQRELVEGDSHFEVRGSRKERVEQTHSISAGSLQMRVTRDHALEAGEDIHLQAGSGIVIEAQDLTLKGPGGFLRIDAGGVTIQGKIVKINSGGTPGAGAGASPESPESPSVAEVSAPEPPLPDDVSRSGLAQ
jgi:type VI secretion system secreted protein VgrG